MLFHNKSSDIILSRRTRASSQRGTWTSTHYSIGVLGDLLEGKEGLKTGALVNTCKEFLIKHHVSHNSRWLQGYLKGDDITLMLNFIEDLLHNQLGLLPISGLFLHYNEPLHGSATVLHTL